MNERPMGDEQAAHRQGGEMTIAEAESKVRKRLRFGDPEQVKAVRLLNEFAIAKHESELSGARLCSACEGKTYCEACGCGRDCEPEECPMKWLQACRLCDERGMLDEDGEPWGDFSTEVMDAMRLELTEVTA